MKFQFTITYRDLAGKEKTFVTVASGGALTATSGALLEFRKQTRLFDDAIIKTEVVRLA